MPTKKPAAKKPAAKKPVPLPVNRDLEESLEILRELMRFSEDDQAKALAAIGLAQLSMTRLH